MADQKHDGRDKKDDPDLDADLDGKAKMDPAEEGSEASEVGDVDWSSLVDLDSKISVLRAAKYALLGKKRDKPTIAKRNQLEADIETHRPV